MVALLLQGAQVGLFMLGTLGAGMFVAGAARIRRSDRESVYVGGVMATLGLLLAAVGFLGPFAAPGGA